MLGLFVFLYFVVTNRAHDDFVFDFVQVVLSPLFNFYGVLCSVLTMHSVQQFENVVLGANDMKKKLVVRTCFLEMRKLAIDWMEAELKGGMPTGVFVITGSPGIGKSVFLAYFVAYLCEKGYNVVIQRGQDW